jgi:hypothetical protein
MRMANGGAGRRSTIWMGSGEGDFGGVQVGTEDSMLSLTAQTPGGDEIEVFIDPGLFPQMREKMGIIER